MSDERARRLSVVCYQTSMKDILFLTVKGGERGSAILSMVFSQHQLSRSTLHILSGSTLCPTKKDSANDLKTAGTGRMLLQLPRKSPQAVIRQLCAWEWFSSPPVFHGLAMEWHRERESAAWVGLQDLLCGQPIRWFYKHSVSQPDGFTYTRFFHSSKLSLVGAATSIILASAFLSWQVLLQRTCVFCNKTHLLSRQKYACRDKTFVQNTLSWQTCLLWQK